MDQSGGEAWPSGCVLLAGACHSATLPKIPSHPLSCAFLISEPSLSSLRAAYVSVKIAYTK